MAKSSSTRRTRRRSTRASTKTAVTPASSRSTAGSQRVRIIGGQYKRRAIGFVDAQGLRPTPDRLRETLFNWLQPYLYGARVLDSCAGSGVLGFEALSRGAAHCTFIETEVRQYHKLHHSAEQLHLPPDAYTVLHGAAEQLLGQRAYATSAGHNVKRRGVTTHPDLEGLDLNSPDLNNSTGHPTRHNRTYDIVFIDPPYAANLWQPILYALISQSLITKKTVLYLEADRDLQPDLAALAQSINDTCDKEFTHKEFMGKDVMDKDASITDTLTSAQPVAFACVKQTHMGQVSAGLYRLIDA